jgi:hypothetical protein
MADTITIKQLADRAGVEARVLRRVLRSQFPREAKGKLYEWQPDDPKIELILKAVGNHKAKPAEQPKAEKPAKPKAKAQPKKQAESKPEKEGQ